MTTKRPSGGRHDTPRTLGQYIVEDAGLPALYRDRDRSANGTRKSHMLVARDARVTPIEAHAPIQRDLILVRRMLLSFANTLQRRIAEEQAERLKPHGGLKAG